MRAIHNERHRSERSGWLRAAVLGADDGLVSTAALLVGLVAAGATRSSLLTAGIAALTAGALAMAIGEFVSVSAQADTEHADRKREMRELETQPEQELDELTKIYQGRGLPQELARTVAETLHENGALEAHLRDELGHDSRMLARPAQAAGASAASFAVGAALPLLAAALSTASMRTAAISTVTVVAMCSLGALGASLGGASKTKGAVRVGVGGTLALAVTYGVGLALGTAI